MPAENQSVIETARTAHRAGLSVIPPREDASKAPQGNWKPFQFEQASGNQMRSWYGPSTGVGLVTGAVSNGLELLEFEGRALDGGEFDYFVELVEADRKSVV